MVYNEEQNKIDEEFMREMQWYADELKKIAEMYDRKVEIEIKENILSVEW